MSRISNLVNQSREIIMQDESFILPSNYQVDSKLSSIPSAGCRVNLVALGDVGGTVLLGLRLLGEGTIDSIGIYDLNEALLRRYEREINQVNYPDGRKLPNIEIISQDQLFDCDMFVFCASKGVPPIGASGDVRMAQLEANKGLVSIYAKQAVSDNFQGIFAVVSDPVDPLCKASLLCGLDSGQIRGYGLGVMNARARYYAEKENKFSQYLSEGRAFGPHGEDLVIADSVINYNNDLSAELTELAVTSNMKTREDGFKPYIAPAMSSGALSLIATLKGDWHYSSLYLGEGSNGAFLGCRNRRIKNGNEVENLQLDETLFERISKAYSNLIKLG